MENLIDYKLPALDIAKYAAAVCVIFIHVYTFNPIENWVVFLLAQGAARLAVPFFFCCTGYFIALKGFEQWSIVFPYLQKLCLSYAVWSLVYIPITLIDMLLNGNLGKETILFQGTFLHLWFFPSLIVAVLTLHYLIKKLPLWTLVTLAILLYCFGLMGDGYYGIQASLPNWLATGFQRYESVFLTTRNGIFFGIPFVLTGVVIAKAKHLPSKSLCLVMFALSLLSSFVEVYLLGMHHIAADYNMTIFLVPCTVFQFCILLQVSFTPRFSCRTLRLYSTILYPSHLLFFGVVLFASDLINLPLLKNSTTQFMLVWGLTQLYAWLWVSGRLKLSNRKSVFL